MSGPSRTTRRRASWIGLDLHWTRSRQKHVRLNLKAYLACRPRVRRRVYHPCRALRHLKIRGGTLSDVSYPRPGRPQFIRRRQPNPLRRSQRWSSRTSYPADQQLPQVVRQSVRKGTLFISFFFFASLRCIIMFFFSPRFIHDFGVAMASSHPTSSVHSPFIRLTYTSGIRS